MFNNIRQNLSSVFSNWPIHAFLFAIFPAIFLYVHNIEETTILVTVKPVALILAGTAVFLFFLTWSLGIGGSPQYLHL